VIDISWCEGWEVGYFNSDKQKNYSLAEDQDLGIAVAKAALKVVSTPWPLEDEPDEEPI